MFPNLWIQMRKNKPLDKSRKSGQTSGMKMAFYSFYFEYIICVRYEYINYKISEKANSLKNRFDHMVKQEPATISTCSLLDLKKQ
ncbi:hypothetical protein Hanom_Chr09g00770001 [Helianthus anomalus]